MINTIRKIVNQDELNAFFIEIEIPGFCNKIELHKRRDAKFFIEYKGEIGSDILFHKTVETHTEKLDNSGYEKLITQGIYFLIDEQFYFYKFPKKYIFELLFYNNLVNNNMLIQAIVTVTTQTTYLTQNETGEKTKKKIVEEVVNYEAYRGNKETLQLVKNAKKSK